MEVNSRPVQFKPMDEEFSRIPGRMRATAFLVHKHFNVPKLYIVLKKRQHDLLILNI